MSHEELFSTHDYDTEKNYNHKHDPYFNEKVEREIHRMMELLRFTPDENGVFKAKCAPVYFVLPALEAYFTARFGDTPWEIIDEKRGLALSRKPGEEVVLARIKTDNSQPPIPGDEWEELWKLYHKTINNESRNNPNLQRQLMPERYWKYLPEVAGSK